MAAGESWVDQVIEEVSSSDEEGSFYEPDEVVKIRRGPRTGSNRKVDTESDDEDESDEPERDMKNRRTGGLSIDRKLSPALADIVGRDIMPFVEVVSKMWAYFRDNNLIDPEDKRMIVCDEKLKKIVPTSKFKGFLISKYLKN